MLSLTPSERLRHVQGNHRYRAQGQARAEWRSLTLFRRSLLRTPNSSWSEERPQCCKVRRCTLLQTTAGPLDVLTTIETSTTFEDLLPESDWLEGRSAIAGALARPTNPREGAAETPEGPSAPESKSLEPR